MTTKRNRRKQTVSFEERLEEAASAAREAALSLPQGPERDVMLAKARQAETARHINDWLMSPGQSAQK